MRRLSRLGRRLRGDSRGVTIVEFGLIIVPLTMTLLVLFDFGFRMYAQAMLEGTLHRAARMATVGDKTQTQIDDYVKSQLKLFSRSTPPEIVKKSYYQFSGVAKDETFTDANNNGKYDVGECFVDENHNDTWDSAKTAGTAGLGGSDDIVFYTVTLKFPQIVPVGRIMGWSTQSTVTAQTVLRNQPYGSQALLPTCST